MEEIQNNIAIYLRISKEEIRKDQNNSIENQRQLILDYINKKWTDSAFTIRVYKDDGFSGTNFQRPGMMQLLEDIQMSKISCVIVKDFSRFGRNYVEVGNLLEIEFPMKHIRFISVNEHYDSFEESHCSWIFFAFQNIMNDYYSRDISKKVKAALKTKKKQGLFMGNVAPYGYQKSDIEKGKLVIDKVSSKIVKAIFEWRLEGKSMKWIALELNRQSILTPYEYRNCTRLTDNVSPKQWTTSSISRILSNPVYKGSVINNRFKAVEIGSNKKRKVKEENWITVSNMHDAIIDEIQFDMVQKLTNRRNKV